jgi:hypothetical protein
MTPYQPFIDDPVHIKALDRQRFVVLRAPLTVSMAYSQIQRIFRQRLRGLPVSCPARAHVTLCGFAAGTSLHAVQELVRSWALAGLRARAEDERLTVSTVLDWRLMGEGLSLLWLARTKGVFTNLPTGEKAKAYAGRLEQLEREARQKRLGIWSSAAEKVSETQSR